MSRISIFLQVSSKIDDLFFNHIGDSLYVWYWYGMRTFSLCIKINIMEISYFFTINYQINP